jgi:hypothetical protein
MTKFSTFGYISPTIVFEKKKNFLGGHFGEKSIPN